MASSSSDQNPNSGEFVANSAPPVKILRATGTLRGGGCLEVISAEICQSDYTLRRTQRTQEFTEVVCEGVVL